MESAMSRLTSDVADINVIINRPGDIGTCWEPSSDQRDRHARPLRRDLWGRFRCQNKSENPAKSPIAFHSSGYFFFRPSLISRSIWKNSNLSTVSVSQSWDLQSWNPHHFTARARWLLISPAASSLDFPVSQGEPEHSTLSDNRILQSHHLRSWDLQSWNLHLSQLAPIGFGLPSASSRLSRVSRSKRA